jgi:uncharacterized heparinase superfamily protein
LLREPGLYFRTVRHLKLSQFYYLVVRRLLPTPAFRPAAVGKVSRNLEVKDWLPLCQPHNLNNEFRFINETRSFDPDNVDWLCEEEKKLWRYNLHYFDFLQWDCFSVELKDKLINSWIENCPMNQWISWDPYAVSLRIVNWIKYFGTFPETKDIPAHWLESLLNQARWQAKNMEYQILANHLIKNAKALVFAGLFFDCEQSKKLLKLGCNVMLRQVREQFMADGGHFERSHMYHLIVTEDYLDLLNLASHHDLPLSDDDLSEIRGIISEAIEYYADLCAGDDELQLFNDSTFGIVASSQEFLAYGERVLGTLTADRSMAPFAVSKAATGYYGYRNAGDSFLLDCGAVGPDYQPGHAHCDALSFDLCIDGQRVIVDSGNYTYEHITMRYENRQTAGHNTVRVDEEEQSEVWERWRVGRRAYPISANLTDMKEGKLSFTGSHDGYQRLSGNVVHERQADLDIVGRWQITDRISGKGDHLLESYLHLHPDVEPVPLEDGAYELLANGHSIARLEIDSGVEISVEASVWCPEFGVMIENKVLVMRRQTELPAQMGYTISKL